MRNMILLTLTGMSLLLAAILVSGCGSTKGSRNTLAGGGAHDEPIGSKLWAQNCSRCHNSRSTDSYNDTQWEVAMMHMRIRANLTADEHRAILEFLKSAN